MKPHRSLFAFLIFVALIPAVSAGDWRENSNPPTALERPLESDPMKVTIHRLGNGLTVYLSPNDQEPRIAAWIGVRAGGAHDPDDSTGMAHYLEHMLFKGSRRLGTLDFEREKVHMDRISELYERLFRVADAAERKKIYAEIDEENQKAARYAIPNEMDKAYKSLGIRGVNAFTSNDKTVYICDMPKNRLEAWARLEADRFAAPVFRLFQNEIETVYEEKNRSLDDPDRILGEALEKLLYKEHPYGRTVLGSVEHLKNPSLAKMYAFYGRYYVPNNMALALSGDFDRAQTLALLERTFGRWEPKELPPRPARTPSPLKGEERVEVRYEAEEQVVLSWRTVGEQHPDADALTVLDMLMDNSESGLINLRLNQAQKVKRAGSAPDMMNEGGAWTLWALPKEGQSLEEAQKLLQETVDALLAGEFSAEDIKAIITDFEVSQKLEVENNSCRSGCRVGAMMDSFIAYEDWAHRVDRLKRLRAVTKADVLRVAKAYLGPDRAVVYRRKGKPEIPSIEKPSFTKVKLDVTRESAFLREILAIPSPEIEPKWLAEGRDYEVLETPSGRLYAAKNPMNDLFALSLRFDRGRKHERALCEALSLLDLSGAGKLTADDLKRRFYALGVKFFVSCSEETSGISLSGLEASLEEALALMRERFRAPNIAADTLEKMVAIEIGAHKDNKVDPDYVSHALEEYAERGNRSAVLSELSDGELRALKRKDLVRLLGQFLEYERDTVYVGTRSASALAGLLERPGGKIRRVPAREPRAYEKPGRMEIVFAHREMVQSIVGMFAPDGIFDPERFVDYSYYRTYMGGGMSSVVFQEVREARSLAYSAWGGYAPGGRKGDENQVAGSLGCQADKTIEATSLLHSLLNDMPAAQERFLEARKSIEQSYRTSPTKFRDVPGQILAWRDIGIEGDPRPERMRRSLAYTLDDLSAFAGRFKQKPMRIHILGNRDKIDFEGLKKLGELTEKKVEELFPY